MTQRWVNGQLLPGDLQAIDAGLESYQLTPTKGPIPKMVQMVGREE